MNQCRKAVIALLILAAFASAAYSPATASAQTATPTAALALSMLPPTLPSNSTGYLVISFSPQTTYSSSSSTPAAAPANATVYLSSSNPQVVAVPSTVQIQAGTAYIPVEVQSLAPGSATIYASATGYTSTSIQVQVDSPSGYPVGIQVYAEPGNPIAQPSFTGQVIVELVGPSGNPAQAPAKTTISLTSSNPKVAGVTPQVTVAAGQEYGYATYNSSLTPGSATLIASATGYTSGSAQIQVAGPTPYQVNSEVAPTAPASGETASLIFWLTDQSGNPSPVPSPVTITVSSSNTQVLNPPQKVVIPAGTYYTVVKVVAGTTGQTTLTAASSGLQPAQTQVAVKQVGSPQQVQVSAPPTPILADNTGQPFLVVQLENQSGEPAYPTSPVQVSLSSSDLDVAAVPATVTIPTLTTYILVKLNTTYLPGETTITAAAQNLKPSTTTVQTYGYAPQYISASATGSIPATGDTYDAVLVTLDTGNGLGVAPSPTVLKLYSSDTAVAQVPSTVEIQPGQSYALIPVTTTATAGTAEITVTTASYSSATVQVTTIHPGASTLQLYLAPPTGYFFPGAPSAYAAVQLYSSSNRPADATSAFTVTVTSENGTVKSKPITLTFRPGQDYALFKLNLSAPGKDTFTAAASGLTSATATANYAPYPIAIQAFTSPAQPTANQITPLIFVVKSNGEPVQGAKITVSVPTGALVGATALHTNARGVAYSNFTAPAPGTYTLNYTVKTSLWSTTGKLTVTVVAPPPVKQPNPYQTKYPVKIIAAAVIAAAVAVPVYLFRDKLPIVGRKPGDQADNDQQDQAAQEGDDDADAADGPGTDPAT